MSGLDILHSYKVDICSTSCCLLDCCDDERIYPNKSHVNSILESYNRSDTIYNIISVLGKKLEQFKNIDFPKEWSKSSYCQKFVYYMGCGQLRDSKNQADKIYETLLLISLPKFQSMTLDEFYKEPVWNKLI